MSNNGKQTEAEIHEVFKDLERSYQTFDYQRLYDATSARGSFQAQVGDFLWFMPRLHGVVEAKSTKHEYRLAKTAFSNRQIPRLLRRARAGSEVWVVVHHWTTDVWRLVPLSVVYSQIIEQGFSSIDLREEERVKTFNSAEDCILNMINTAMENSK